MIEVDEIGIKLMSPADSGRLSDLEAGLARYHELGYRLVEINPRDFHLIVNGELRQKPLKNFLAVLNNFDLRYSIHGLSRLNLAFDPRVELCNQIMQCQIEICQAVGATRLVYHSGLDALVVVRYNAWKHLHSEDELAAGALREVEALQKHAVAAADAGVVICMENGVPQQWEYELLGKFDRPRAELLNYDSGLQISPILRQLEQIDHPNVALTLDVGHLLIAANDLGFDYLEAVEEASPWTKHIHVNENLGKIDWGFDLEPDRIAFGEADIHLPPGWGGIPYHDILARLPDYRGDLILEIKPGFHDYIGESLENMRDILYRFNNSYSHKKAKYI